MENFAAHSSDNVDVCNKSDALKGLEYCEVVRAAEEVGRRATVVREGPRGRELVDAVVVSASQINNIPHFAQLRETLPYRNGLVTICCHFMAIYYWGYLLLSL